MGSDLIQKTGDNCLSSQESVINPKPDTGLMSTA